MLSTAVKILSPATASPFLPSSRMVATIPTAVGEYRRSKVTPVAMADGVFERSIVKITGVGVFTTTTPGLAMGAGIVSGAWPYSNTLLKTRPAKITRPTPVRGLYFIKKIVIHPPEQLWRALRVLLIKVFAKGKRSSYFTLHPKPRPALIAI